MLRINIKYAALLSFIIIVNHATVNDINSMTLTRTLQALTKTQTQIFTMAYTLSRTMSQTISSTWAGLYQSTDNAVDPIASTAQKQQQDVVKQMMSLYKTGQSKSLYKQLLALSKPQDTLQKVVSMNSGATTSSAGNIITERRPDIDLNPARLSAIVRLYAMNDPRIKELTPELKASIDAATGIDFKMDIYTRIKIREEFERLFSIPESHSNDVDAVLYNIIDSPHPELYMNVLFDVAKDRTNNPSLFNTFFRPNGVLRCYPDLVNLNSNFKLENLAKEFQDDFIRITNGLLSLAKNKELSKTVNFGLQYAVKAATAVAQSHESKLYLELSKGIVKAINGNPVYQMLIETDLTNNPAYAEKLLEEIKAKDKNSFTFMDEPMFIHQQNRLSTAESQSKETSSENAAVIVHMIDPEEEDEDDGGEELKRKVDLALKAIGKLDPKLHTPETIKLLKQAVEKFKHSPRFFKKGSPLDKIITCSEELAKNPNSSEALETIRTALLKIRIAMIN